jgi:hypothetical protein
MSSVRLNAHHEATVTVHYGNCTECEGLVAIGVLQSVERSAEGFPVAVNREVPMFPARPRPRSVPEGTPKDVAQDFSEAALVLADSPKASAALSRRILQHVLREEGGFKGRDLNAEIEAAIKSGTLPPALADDLDAVRHVGNFSAHPIKSTHTGEVVPVEPGEAEWVLDVVDDLLQHYFTAPALRAARRASLNAKLQEAGKPALKDNSGAASPVNGS